MKKRFFISLISSLLTLVAWAQQEASFSTYVMNPLNINAAYAGVRADLSTTILHRSQWVGLNGAPNTESVNIDGLIKKYKLGLGVQLSVDKAGPIKNTIFQLGAAYHIKIDKKTKLSFGLQGSLSSLSVAWNKINIENVNDQSFANVNTSSIVPDANFGMFIYRERFFTGLSATHLLQSNFDLNNSGTNTAKFYRHYYLTAGKFFKWNDDIDIKPMAMVKYVKGSPLNLSLIGSLIFYEKFTAGIGIQGNKRIGIKGIDSGLIAMLEYKIDSHFRVAYCYDTFFSSIGAHNFGSHEIMLGWDLNYKKKVKTETIFVDIENLKTAQ